MSGRPLAYALSGATIAFVGAICGIGGGLFAVPLLHYVFRLELRAAVATSLTLVFATAAASTVTESFHADSALLPNIVLPLIGGALVGAQFGYFLSRRISEVWLKGAFTVILSFVGLRLLLSPSGAGAPRALAEALDALQIAQVLFVGLLAGTVAPLLGIGGGLIVVPGLLLLVPGAGYLGARAASLAMAVVTSSRSVHLYWREGAVDVGVARWFGGGALIGASAGVQVAHLEGIERVGQSVLGAILLVTAVRFGLDVSRRWRGVEPRRKGAESPETATEPRKKSA